MSRFFYSFYLLLPLFLVGLVFPSGRLSAQETVSYNTTLFDTLNPSTAGRYSALWGYTAPDGREYALLGGLSGTHIVDITEKPIREVTFIPGPSSGWREMKTYSHYAYVVSEGGAGLQIIDLSNLPASASLVKSDTSAFRTGHSISQEGKWVYVHGSNVDAGANQGTLILNVADDPENPVLVGKYDRDYVHDAHIRNDTMYTAMINHGRLDIVYLGPDRTNPQLVTEIAYPGGGTHNADVTIDGRYIMTTDEVGFTNKTLKVWDRADMDDIAKVADWTADENAIIHNVHIRGTVAYVAWYTAGTRIVDIADPLNPVEIGFYDMFPGGGERYAGNWETYPYFASGKIISSDMGNGLYVFTFDGAKKGLVNGIVRDDRTGNPIPNATIEVPDLGRTIVSDADGRFQILAAEGEVEFSAIALNYKPKTGTMNLSSDGTEVEIRLDPLRLRDVQVAAIDDESGEAIEKFSFDVRTRGESIVDPSIPVTLHLPADSGYALHIGAWGWLPADTIINPDVEGNVAVRLKRGYADDAELDLGWSFSQPDDDATGGFWERGVPNGVFIQFGSNPPAQVEPDSDHTVGVGTKAFMTEIIDGSDSSPGIADVDSGHVTLTSPQFDLTGYVSPRISFALWYSNDALPIFPADDRLYVRLSNDAGAHWSDVLTLESHVADWEEHTIRVADFMLPTAEMMFRVVASDSNGQGWTEAGLDDFRVTDTVTSGVEDGITVAGLASVHVLPNPVGTAATFTITLPTAGREGRLELFDLLGRQVATIYRGAANAGTKRVEFRTDTLSAGQYIWRLMLDDGGVVSGNMSVVH